MKTEFQWIALPSDTFAISQTCRVREVPFNQVLRAIAIHIDGTGEYMSGMGLRRAHPHGEVLVIDSAWDMAYLPKVLPLWGTWDAEPSSAEMVRWLVNGEAKDWDVEAWKRALDVIGTKGGRVLAFGKQFEWEPTKKVRASKPKSRSA